MQAEEATIPRLSQMFRIRVPAGLPAAVEIAARRKLTSPAEWARAALLDALRADGVRLGPEGRIAIPNTNTERELA